MLGTSNMAMNKAPAFNILVGGMGRVSVLSPYKISGSSKCYEEKLSKVRG